MDAFLLAPILSSLMENLLVAIAEMAAKASLVEELRCVKAELKTLESYLKDISEKQDTNRRIRDYVRDVKETLYQVEDDLDLVLYESHKSNLARFWNLFDANCFGSRVFADVISVCKYKIRAVCKNLDLLGVQKTEGGVKGLFNFSLLERFHQRYGRLKFSIGLEDDVEMVVHNLFDEKPDRICSIIPICGMGGIGKTTLARKVYNDGQVRHNFEGFAWAEVGHKFQTRKVFQDIFLQLAAESDEQEIIAYSNLELVMRLYQIQLSKKYLIVLDDVWDKDDWKCLNLAFPSRNSGSKLIVTTRNKELVEAIADKGIAHHMRTLTNAESWKLFVEKTSSVGVGLPSKFFDNQSDREMHEIAMKMVEKCNGLPLAIVLLGQLLGRKHTRDEWKLAYQSFDSYVSGEQSPDVFPKIPRVFALHNYFDLPDYLKPCFLYLGLFPEDSQIRSETLVQLWTAEGLIPSTTERNQVKVDIAECYLDELINRELICLPEGKAPTDRKSKLIHVHDFLRDLCVLKGKAENFTEAMDLGTPHQPKHFDPQTRRLALFFEHNDDKHFVALKNEKLHMLRSLLLFNCNQHEKDKVSAPASSNLKHLRSLRILHFDGFKFETGKSLKGLEELIALKYLSLSQCVLDELPSTVGKLIHLHTLDLQVENSTSIYIPNVLYRIVSLRRLYLPLHFWVTPDEKLRLDTLKNLEAVKNFDASLCNAKDLIKLTNLRHLDLTTEWNLDDLEAIANCLNTKSESLCRSSLNIRSLNCYLEKRDTILRKLISCPSLYSLHIEGNIGNLPQMISSSLTEIVLSGAELVEDPMATLEKFPRLCILELKNESFLGKQMACSGLGFPQLRLLKLSNLHNLENLSIEKGAMPNLSTLAIESCKKLNVSLVVFNHLGSLQWLKIMKSWRQVQGDKRNPSEVPDVHAT